MTALNASPSDSPPAVVAPGPPARAPASAPVHPGSVTVRGALTLGEGKQGVAGAYAVELDVWPFTYFGIGAEWTGGGSTDLRWNGSSGDALSGGRARASARVALSSRLFGMATLAGGVARAKSLRSYREDGREDYTYSSRRTTVPTVALELGFYARSGVLHVGGVLRLDAGGPVSFATVGPVLGLTF